MYTRKTTDEYDVEQLTRYGWEVVTCEENRKEAKVRLHEYRENQPGAYRINHHRIPKEEVKS